MTRRKLVVGDRVRLTAKVIGTTMPGVGFTALPGVVATVVELREDGLVLLRVGSGAVACLANVGDFEVVR